MNKLNTIQNGKGSKPRKNFNWGAYWNAEYWNKKTKKEEKTVSEYSSPDK